MIIQQQWKEELVALVNSKNSLNLKTTDVNFTIDNRDVTTGAVTVKILPDVSGPYFNEQSIVYIPRDIAKNFVGIPLRFIVHNDTTMREMVSQLSRRYGISLEEAVDFTKEALDKTITFDDAGIKTVEVDVADSSFVWVGKLQFVVANDTLDLEVIIANIDLTNLTYIAKVEGKGSLDMLTVAEIMEHGRDVPMVGKSVEKTVFATYLQAMVDGGLMEAADAAAILAVETTDSVAMTVVGMFDSRKIIKTANSYETDRLVGNVYALQAGIPKTTMALRMKMAAGDVELMYGGADSKFTLDWGDGTATVHKDAGTTPTFNHTYSGVGPYYCTVVVDEIPATPWNSNSSNNYVKGTALLEVLHWENQVNNAVVLSDCGNLTDVPAIWYPEWTSMAKLFRNDAKFLGNNLADWDTVGVTDISDTFSGCSSFNADIGGWDTSKVVYAGYLFFNASKFNQDISDWNVSKITSANGMFNGANKFNQPIGKWKPTSIKYMANMFASCVDFNADLSSWVFASTVSASTYDSNTSKWEANHKPTFL